MHRRFGVEENDKPSLTLRSVTYVAHHVQCNDLLKLLSSYVPKDASKTETKEEESKEKAWLQGAAGKLAGKDLSDPFADLAVSKKVCARACVCLPAHRSPRELPRALWGGRGGLRKWLAWIASAFWVGSAALDGWDLCSS